MPPPFGPVSRLLSGTALGGVPLHIAVSSELGLSTAASSSWMFIVWMTGAVASIALSLHYLQPIPITLDHSWLNLSRHAR